MGKERERLAKIEERLIELKSVWNYCKNSKIQLGNIIYPGNFQQHQADYLPQLVNQNGVKTKPGEVPVSANWNCLFLYPQYSTFDIVTDINENEMIAIQSANIFPEHEDDEFQGYNGVGANSRAHWDRKGEYQCSELDIYIQA